MPPLTTTAPAPLAARLAAARPLFRDPCPAGFPSPASDYVERPLDLNEHLGTGRPSTFFVRAEGRSEMGAGVWSGDLLVVDLALTPVPGDLVVAFVSGEHTVKRYGRDARGAYLAPDPLPEEAGDYAEIRPGEAEEIVVCGVVTHAVRAFRAER